MNQVRINSLFAEQLIDFRHLVTFKKQTKDQFLQKIKETYSLENVKTRLFYAACKESMFNTIRLSILRSRILFNQ